MQVKGRIEQVDLFEIMWDANNDATITMSAQFMPPKVPVRLRLLHGGREVSVGSDRPVISIGRDGVNELVVDERKASRVHARIEWRRDKFVLTDVSTNGTYVIADDGPETCLRREEYILDGSGTISLGRSHNVGPRNCFNVILFARSSAAANARVARSSPVAISSVRAAITESSCGERS